MRDVTPPDLATYRFDDFVVDGRERMLLRGGDHVPLPALTFDTLYYLVAHAGHLARKEEMLAALWPDVVVSDNALTRVIKEVRHALGDKPEDARYLQTVRGAGYKFIAEVQSSNAPAAIATPVTASPPVQRRTAAIAGLLVAALALIALLAWRSGNTPTIAPEHSLAVLAFENMSGDPEQSAFCDGLSEELLNRLAGVEGLLITARTSAFSLKGLALDVPTIAERLGVRHVLEGSVRRDGDTLRVTAQLVNAKGFHLWSQTYDRPVDELFAVQDDIAIAVTKQLEVELLGPRTRIAGQHGTDNAEAYRHFVIGMGHFHAYTGDGRDLAIKSFEHAIATDSDFAIAYAFLSMALLPRGGDTDESALERARQLAMRALEITPDLAEGYAALGRIEVERSEVDLSRRQDQLRYLSQALALRPDLVDARNWYATALASQGLLREGLEQRQRAALTDPLHAAVQGNLAIDLARLGRFDEAEAKYREILSWANPPEYINQNLLVLLITRGRYLAALRAGITAATTWPDTRGWQLVTARVLALLDLGDDAQRWYNAAGDAENKWHEDLQVDYLNAAGRYADAAVLIAQHIAVLEAQHEPPETWSMYFAYQTASMYAHAGDWNGLIRVAQRRFASPSAITGWRGDFTVPADFAQYLIEANRRRGIRSDALLAAIDRETALRREHGYTGNWSLTLIEARNLLLRENYAAAINKLQQAELEGFRDGRALRDDPRWQRILSDPDVIALLESIDLEVARMRADVLADASLMSAIRSPIMPRPAAATAARKPSK